MTLLGCCNITYNVTISQKKDNITANSGEELKTSTIVSLHKEWSITQGWHKLVTCVFLEKSTSCMHRGFSIIVNIPSDMSNGDMYFPSFTHANNKKFHK